MELAITFSFPLADFLVGDKEIKRVLCAGRTAKLAERYRSPFPLWYRRAWTPDLRIPAVQRPGTHKEIDSHK